ncbi:hypothetical protein [Massilia sp. CCM 8734]|uniref:hypothetical protein n=1 Tax=Massilia sp. CCM 8734 TaxID=2609283 RepID=UPI00141F711F|nr:hypothetical protein [Massilia sp. CCM 8734]NHZ99098.1 hypothetical protein [Massilia sp. CCM 8734]
MKRTDDLQAVNGAPFLSRDDAESRLCNAIAALGRLAGIEVDQGEGPEDIDSVLIDAAYQCNFADPHFLGGPCAFNYVETADDVDKLAMKAAPVIRGLLGYIRKCDFLN